MVSNTDDLDVRCMVPMFMATFSCESNTTQSKVSQHENQVNSNEEVWRN